MTRPIFFKRLLIQSSMLTTFLGTFQGPLQKKKRHGYFMHDDATAPITNYVTDALNKVSEDRPVSHRNWPAMFPDLNPCDLYLWKNIKNKVYSNNPQTGGT
jgi:hypothetical protein